MSMVQINWSPNTRDLRLFGLTLIVGFALIGALLFWRGLPNAAYACWIFGAIGGILGLTGTRAALPIYYGWMGLAFVLGQVMTRVVLALVYYLVFTPMGLVTRLAGRDVLQLKRPNKTSYWIDLPPPPEKERYERQF